MAGETKNYFYAGIAAVVALSALAIFAAVAPQENPGSTGHIASELNLAVSSGSGTKSFSAAVDEEALFSGEPVALAFSSAGAQGPFNINCTIACEKEMQ